MSPCRCWFYSTFSYRFRSWQSIKFPKMPVTFVKIVGTHNTANEVRLLRFLPSIFNAVTQKGICRTGREIISKALSRGTWLRSTCKNVTLYHIILSVHIDLFYSNSSLPFNTLDTGYFFSCCQPRPKYFFGTQRKFGGHIFKLRFLI